MIKFANIVIKYNIVKLNIFLKYIIYKYEKSFETNKSFLI